MAEWLKTRRLSGVEILVVITVLALLVATIALTLNLQRNTNKFRHALAATCLQRQHLSEINHTSIGADMQLYGGFLAALETYNSPTPAGEKLIRSETIAVRTAFNAKKAAYDAYTIPVCVD